MISVGELNDNQNHGDVIEATHKLEFDYEYYIVGSGKKQFLLEEQIKRFEMSSKIKLLGYQDDITNLLKESDVFIMPSKREGLPLSVMEAMAASLPVIATRIRGNVDLIDHQKGGYLVSLSDSNQLASYIDELYHNAKARIDMGRYNHSKIQAFDSKKISLIMKDIYSSYIK
jgi:glycosyltransferase involved in cell wall biosynthesis